MTTTAVARTAVRPLCGNETPPLASALRPTSNDRNWNTKFISYHRCRRPQCSDSMAVPAGTSSPYLLSPVPFLTRHFESNSTAPPPFTRQHSVSDVLMEGTLDKKSPKSFFGIHAWQSRYFVLTITSFKYYQSPEAYQADDPSGTSTLYSLT